MEQGKKYLIIGEDEEMNRETINTLYQSWNTITHPLTFKKLIWKGEKAKEEEWKKTLQQTTFFAQKMVVINGDNLHLTNGKEQKKILAKWAQTEHYLVIVSKKKFKKEAMDFLAANFTIKLVAKFNKTKKTKIVEKTLLVHKIKFKQEVLIFLRENLPNSLGIVKNEMIKINTFLKASKKQELPLELVKKIVTVEPETLIFPLIEALLTNQPKTVLSNLNQKHQKTSLLVLLATLTTYLFQIRKIKFLLQKKLSFGEMVQKMAKPPFLVFNLMKIAQKTDSQFLTKLGKKVQKIEYNAKMLGVKEEILLMELLT